jgi:hypothetical protein
MSDIFIKNENVPSSQSHFGKFENFVPHYDASFDDEFSRLASSQDWIPGSQQYTRERTIAMREELKRHFFTQSQPLDGISEELTEPDKLMGFQSLCIEVGIPASESIAECREKLKSTLVNIVDLIDARRVGKKVKIWHDFEDFRRYTLRDGYRIDVNEAKKDGGYLTCLLQRLRDPRKRKKRGSKRSTDISKTVVSGRVMKKFGHTRNAAHSEDSNVGKAR